MLARIWRSALPMVVLLGVLGAGCGSGEAPQSSGRSMAARPPGSSGENRPPQIESVRLNPPEPVPGQRVEAVVSASDPDNDPIRFTFTWQVNDRTAQSGPSALLGAAQFSSGDRISLEVVATDGHTRSEPYRTSSDTADRAPVIGSVFLEPTARVTPGQPVTALVDAVDPDGDTVRLDYTWFVNGNEQSQRDKTFSTEGLRRGDKLRVRVVARDSRQRNVRADSQELTLDNSPPVFAGVPRIEQQGGVFSYRLEAKDPDGDRSLRFQLAEAPVGMTLDPLTGVARWQPATSQAGEHVVKAVVKDGRGAEAWLSWTMNVSVEPPRRAGSPAAPAP